VEARARYDRTLASAAEGSFRESIDFALESVATILATARTALLDEAGRLGLAPDRAAIVLEEECRKRDVRVLDADEDGTSKPAPSRWLRCRRCGGVTALERPGQALGSVSCRHCQASLRWDCPLCKRSSLVDEVACSCGFAQAWAEPFARLWEEAESLYRGRRHEAALAALEQLRAIAPRFALLERIASKIERRREQADRSREELDRAIASRRLTAARSMLDALAQLVPDDDPGYLEARGVVDRDVRDAATLIARATPLIRTDPDLARTLLRKALTLVADSPEAERAMHSCPPGPPAGLVVETDPAGVSLRWAGPPPDPLGALTYRVRRATGADAKLVGSAPILIESGETLCRDQFAPSGVSLWYAVTTVREGIESLTSATAGPVVLLREVSDLRLESTTRAVSITWTPPPSARSVQVRRTSTSGGPPAEIACAQGRALDEGVEPDRPYRYTIRVVYPPTEPGGPPRLSNGLVVEAFTASRPMPVMDLDLKAQADGSLRVGWEARGAGRVSLYRLDRPPGIPPGQPITAEALDRLSAVALPHQYEDHAIDPDPSRFAASHYLPVTSWNGTATAGRAALWLSIPDPSDLRVARSVHPGQVLLRWRWATGAGSSLVLARSGGPPEGPEDDRAIRFEVAESDYAREGRMRLTLPPDQPGPWHLSVRSVIRVDGRTTISEGADPSSRLVLASTQPVVQVSYQIHRPGFPGRAWRVSLRTDPPGREIPPTALVSHARTVPLSVDDGDIIDHFPATRDGASFRVRGDAARHLAEGGGQSRVRLFVDPRTDPSSSPLIRIRHPGSESTRV
jgi:hypothetical protein